MRRSGSRGPPPSPTGDGHARASAQAKEASGPQGVERLGEDVIGLRSLARFTTSKGFPLTPHHAEVLGQTRRGHRRRPSHARPRRSSPASRPISRPARGSAGAWPAQLARPWSCWTPATPAPTAPRAHARAPGTVKGKAILVSGHDLMDLEQLLEADRGQGHQRLYPRRDAAHPRLSGAEEVPPLLRPLRHRLAEPDARSSPSSPAPS